MLAGRVVLCKPDTGEIVVSVTVGVTGENRARELPCQVTRDSELYINDRLVTIEELQTGDAVELIGYHDANASIARFVISTASIGRDVRWPDPPDFESPPPNGR